MNNSQIYSFKDDLMILWAQNDDKPDCLILASCFPSLSML